VQSSTERSPEVQTVLVYLKIVTGCFSFTMLGEAQTSSVTSNRRFVGPQPAATNLVGPRRRIVEP
jgi:hypothetical protein